MNIGLKPCPFCGHVAPALLGESAPEWWVACQHCHASTQARTTSKQAVEEWNTRAAIELGRQGRGEPVESTLAAHTDLLTYVLQDDVHNRLTPRVVDIAYTAFMQAKRPNDEDGGASDWFNDTKPVVMRAIEKLRKDLFTDRAAKAPHPDGPTVKDCLTVAEPVKEVSDLYPPMPDRSKWTLCHEITHSAPIDCDGGEDRNEPRYIITAAQLDRLDQIESALLARKRVQPASGEEITPTPEEYQPIETPQADPAMAGDELPDPIGFIAADEDGQPYGCTFFHSLDHTPPVKPFYVYSADQMRKRVQPASGEDAKRLRKLVFTYFDNNVGENLYNLMASARAAMQQEKL